MAIVLNWWLHSTKEILQKPIAEDSDCDTANSAQVFGPNINDGLFMLPRVPTPAPLANIQISESWHKHHQDEKKRLNKNKKNMGPQQKALEVLQVTEKKKT